MSRTLEASVVMPVSVLILIFLFLQMMMALNSCFQTAGAALSVEEEARKRASFLSLSSRCGISVDLAPGERCLERLHTNSAQLLYLSLAVEDDVRLVRAAAFAGSSSASSSRATGDASAKGDQQ